MRGPRRVRALLVLLVLTALTFVALDVRSGKGSPFGSVRSAASGAIGPVENAIGGVVSPIGSFFHRLGHAGGEREIADLRAKNQQLTEQLRTSARARARATELEKLLGLAGRGGYRVVGAQVVALGGTFGFDWTATINRGSRDGIKAQMSVLNGDGLVGKVTRVGRYSSTVLLAIDATAAVGVRVEGTGEFGTVVGRGEGQPLEFTAISSNITLHPGQRLVTLGPPDSGYAAELPVGTITKIESTSNSLQARALVKPFVGFTALDAVGVVVEVPNRPAADSVLPTRSPSPSPSSSPLGPAAGLSPGTGESASPGAGASPGPR